VLHGPAWPGQPLLLELARERATDERAASTDAESDWALFRARLTLHLPRLGRVEVELRLAGQSVAVDLHVAQPAAFAAHLAELSSRLQARGLSAAQVRSAPLAGAGPSVS
jgi:Flagellar hook-length control protein FliK